MQSYEYQVIPAPDRGKRGKGAKGFAGRFANALSIALNEMAEDGWEYVRAESLPSTDRAGITRKKVESFQNVLVFRRPIAVETEEAALPVVPVMAPAPAEREDPPLNEEVQEVDDSEIEEVVEDAVEETEPEEEEVKKDRSKSKTSKKSTNKKTKS